MTGFYEVCKTDCYREGAKGRSLGKRGADGPPHRAMACHRAEQTEMKAWLGEQE